MKPHKEQLESDLLEDYTQGIQHNMEHILASIIRRCMMHSWQSCRHVFGYNKSPNYDCPVSYAGCSRYKLLYLFVNMQCSVIQRFLYCENLHKGKNHINSIIEKLKVVSLALQQFQIKNTATGQHTTNNNFFFK